MAGLVGPGRRGYRPSKVGGSIVEPEPGGKLGALMEIVVAALGHRPEQPEAAVGDSGPDVGKSTQQRFDVFQRVDPSHPNERRHGRFRLRDWELSRVDAVVHRADTRRGRAVGDLPKAVVTAYRGDEVGLLVGHLREQFEKAQDNGAGRLAQGAGFIGKVPFP